MKDQQSVGAVTPRIATFAEPLRLKSGDELAGYELAYETYGTLNADRSNAVLVCHALNASHHVAGYYADDRQRRLVGQPGRTRQAARYASASSSSASTTSGGCFGSTGPRRVNPGNRQALGRGLSGGDGGRLGRGAGAPCRPASASSASPR